MPRSLEMLASVLAVMIAGGVYVPLDPQHPRTRLETILAESGASFLLHSGELELTTTATRVSPSTEGVSPSGLAPSSPARADSLAYVIYTSGSTGVPKGVAIEHAALTNLLRSMQQEPGLGCSDVLVAINYAHLRYCRAGASASAPHGRTRSSAQPRNRLRTPPCF